MAIRRVHKPIWGFGWAGWTLLAIALLLTASLVTGFELRFELQKLVLLICGVDLMLYATVALWFYQVHYLGTGAGVVPLVLAAVAFQISSRRIGIWPFAVLAALGVLWPALPTAASYLHHQHALQTIPISRWFLYWSEPVSIACFTAIVVFVTRSWLVGICCLTAVGAAAFGDSILEFLFSDAAESWVPEACLDLILAIPTAPTTLLTWPLLAIALGFWAIRDRRKYAPHCTCTECGYTREGLAENVQCPECGAAPELNQAPSPPPAPPPRAPAP